jgi:hypothetical protein
MRAARGTDRRVNLLTAEITLEQTEVIEQIEIIGQLRRISITRQAETFTDVRAFTVGIAI